LIQYYARNQGYIFCKILGNKASVRSRRKKISEKPSKSPAKPFRRSRRKSLATFQNHPKRQVGNLRTFPVSSRRENQAKSRRKSPAKRRRISRRISRRRNPLKSQYLSLRLPRSGLLEYPVKTSPDLDRVVKSYLKSDLESLLLFPPRSCFEKLNKRSQNSQRNVAAAWTRSTTSRKVDSAMVISVLVCCKWNIVWVSTNGGTASTVDIGKGLRMFW